VGLARVFRGLFIAALVAKRRGGMGKYFVGRLLGVPVDVLVIIYLFMHYAALATGSQITEDQL
jgi:hypothetical protein